MTNELYHHGVKGQKWYVRRWQNEDGSLTPAGRIHYGYGEKNLDPKVADPNSVNKILKSMSSTDLKMLNIDSPMKYDSEYDADYHFVKKYRNKPVSFIDLQRGYGDEDWDEYMFGFDKKEYNRLDTKYKELEKQVDDAYLKINNSRKDRTNWEKYRKLERWHFPNPEKILNENNQNYLSLVNSFNDFFEKNTEDIGYNVVIGTDSNSRGCGYASKLAKEVVDWVENQKDEPVKILIWRAYSDNTGSIKTAQKAGFKISDQLSTPGETVLYYKKKSG